MTTPNLAIPLVVASQNQKEVTANAAFTALDRAITSTFVADVAAGNVTLTSAQYREALGVRVVNVTVPGALRGDFANASLNTSSIAFVLDRHV